MGNIKAIDTQYNGYRFRSRLEARWAIYFDLIGLEYQYEPEGIRINSTTYLPDFYIPKFNTYVEIKAIGALLYDYDDNPLRSGRENADKYNDAYMALTANGYKYVLVCGTPLDIINYKDNAFWFAGYDDDIYDGVISVIDNIDYKPEAEGASYARFEHGESPFNYAKRHAESIRIAQKRAEERYRSRLADPDSLESLLEAWKLRRQNG